jgi:hypothetical protein
MSANTRTTLLSLAIIMVLIFSAVRPKPAYADDNTPPAVPTAQATEASQPADGTDGTSTEEATSPPPTEEGAPLAGGATPTEPAQDPAATEETPPVAVESTPTEPAPTEETAPAAVESTPTEAVQDPAATEVPATAEAAQGPATQTAPVADILSAVPENTDVTVLDANGEAQPLATQEAADAIATSDPIWCPGSQAPTPGQNNCTQSFSSFDALLTFLSGNSAVQGPGTIYVQQGAYQGNDPNRAVDLNSPAYDLSNINKSDLTVTGGWNPATNTVDTTTPTTFSGYSILIGSSTNPWGGTLTINNISITFPGVPDLNDSTNGLTLYATGDVNLSNVNVTAAPGIGAEVHAGRDANIRNSNFQQNVRDGALVRAGRDANVANSSFVNPFLDRDRWQAVGLDIQSGASTSLFGVIANMNREAGVNIIAGEPVSIDSSVFSSNMYRWTENGQDMFGGYGLQVTTTGATSDIALSNITANNNFLWGAKLNAGGNIAIADSTFNANSTDQPGFIDDTGLFITGGQDVALDNVTANENRLYGAQIDVNGTVSVNNSNFNNNVGVTTINGVTNYYGTGLQVNTLSDIFINNTNANGNSLFGGQLNGGGGVSITGGSFSNTSTTVANALLGKGLEIVSGGDTSLLNVVLNGNQTVGADIQAQGNAYLDTLTVTNNGTDGVVVQAACVYLNGGQYSGNGQYGLNLGSSALDILGPAVFSGNVSGDIFPATPASCAPAATSGSSTPTSESGTPAGGTSGGTTTPGDTGSGNAPLPLPAGNVPAAAPSSPTAPSLFTDNAVFQAAASSSPAKNISLATFLANSDTGIGLFTGSYAYLDTDEGIMVIALAPAAEQGLAMSLP